MSLINVRFYPLYNIFTDYMQISNRRMTGLQLLRLLLCSINPQEQQQIENHQEIKKLAHELDYLPEFYGRMLLVVVQK